MLAFPWKKKPIKLDWKVLRKNDISLLILDERWNRLFANIPKTPAIERCEQKLRELLMEEAWLTAEQKEIAALKKKHMDNIMKLTTDVFEKNDENAKNDMKHSESEIKRINSRLNQIDGLLDNMPERIRQANLELLGETIEVVYFRIRYAQKRVEELEKLIEETRTKLKEYIEEKESLSQDDTDIYSYFHDLLGAEELEKLDRKYFSKKGKTASAAKG